MACCQNAGCLRKDMLPCARVWMYPWVQAMAASTAKQCIKAIASGHAEGEFAQLIPEVPDNGLAVHWQCLRSAGTRSCAAAGWKLLRACQTWPITLRTCASTVSKSFAYRRDYKVLLAALKDHFRRQATSAGLEEQAGIPVVCQALAPDPIGPAMHFSNVALLDMLSVAHAQITAGLAVSFTIATNGREGATAVYSDKQ
jgi:hypothetical protein